MAEEKFFNEVIKKLEEQNKILRDGLLKPKVPKKDAADREEEKEGAGKEKDKIDILKEIAKNTSGMGSGGDGDSLPKPGKTGKMGLPAKIVIGIALIAIPIIALVAFFKQLAIEFMWFKKITGKGLTKLFSPFKSLFEILKKSKTFGPSIEKLTKLIKKLLIKSYPAGAEVHKEFKKAEESVLKREALIRVREIF